MLSLTSPLKALICCLWLLRWLLGKLDKCHVGLECNFRGETKHRESWIQRKSNPHWLIQSKKKGNKHIEANWFWNQFLASQPRGWKELQRLKDSEVMILNYLQCTQYNFSCGCCPGKHVLCGTQRRDPQEAGTPSHKPLSCFRVTSHFALGNVCMMKSQEGRVTDVVPGMWPPASHLISLRLCCLIYKMAGWTVWSLRPLPAPWEDWCDRPFYRPAQEITGRQLPHFQEPFDSVC